MERSLMKGNEALAEAAIRAGCKCFFGYPITPQTELSAYMAKRMEKSGGVFLQAESEIAAINMVLGAASTGVRDYNQATHAMGHGDFHILVYAPCSVQEMVDTVTLAFDKADQYRMPAMILADGLLGQMMEPVTFPEPRTTLPDKSDWAANGHGNKREHHIINSLYLDAPLLEAKVQERFKRYAIIEETETDAELYCCDDAEIVVTAYGASARVSKSAVTAARRKGIKAGLCRPKTLWPFPKKELCEATKHASHILDVEMSMGQMIDDVRLATECRLPVSFFGRTGGVIPTPAEVLAEIEKLAGGAE